MRNRDGSLLQIGIRERAAQLHARVKLGEDPADDKAIDRYVRAMASRMQTACARSSAGSPFQ
jgi:hypothetical protein